MTLVAGESSTESSLEEVGLHRPGLALAGYTSVYSSKQIQIIGHTEWNYLESVGSEERKRIFRNLSQFRAPMWVVTHNQKPHDELIEMCTHLNIPLFASSLYTFDFFFKAKNILERYFAPYTKIHGSLVDVYGIGMLYIGDSNVGKSECVLDLVERGHRLVADDAVQLMQLGDVLIGQADPLIAHCIEIRGVGVLDIRSMFGIHAVRKTKRVEVIVELKIKDENDNSSYDRTGLSDEKEDVMGIKIPRILIPVTPGKNLAVISEVVAMNILMKAAGEDSSKKFNERLLNKIKQKQSGKYPENFGEAFFDMGLSPYE